MNNGRNVRDAQGFSAILLQTLLETSLEFFQLLDILK